MTVKELQDKLAEFPPDMEVKMNALSYTVESGDFSSIHEVSRFPEQRIYADEKRCVLLSERDY